MTYWRLALGGRRGTIRALLSAVAFPKVFDSELYFSSPVRVPEVEKEPCAWQNFFCCFGYNNLGFAANCHLL